tara:strand:+ start:247 stop:420 length:174 start_codon:yes stop_codon:yes gene_type:complete
VRNRHPDTLTSIISMGGLLQAMGKLEEARPLLEEALQACKETRFACFVLSCLLELHK